MKYLNQLNLLLMLLGCVVAAYTFSVTFFRQETAVPRNIDVPQFGSQPGESGTGSPLMRRSTTTAIPAVERDTPRRNPYRRSGGLGNLPGSAPRPLAEDARRPTRSEVLSQQGGSSGPSSTQVGERACAVTVNRDASENAPERPSSGVRAGAETAFPRSQPVQPAPSAEAEKRNESQNPPSPITRSSLMGRRPQ